MDSLKPRSGRPMGVYVHFPFCLRRCPYCDFNVTVSRQLPHRAYADAVIEELLARRGDFDGRGLVSVYFGGGTPGLWRPQELQRVLTAILESFDCLEDPIDVAQSGTGLPLEVTVEINPRQAPAEVLAALRAAGANRLSVGCQSFDDQYLRALGRDHDATQGRDTLCAAAQAGWGRVNLDLIYGGPGHSMEIFDRDLIVAGQADVDHISAYQLTVHEGTPFARQRAEGRLRVANDEVSSAMDTLCEEVLGDAGFIRYEVSNYARPGGIARHNSLYWSGAEYMGLGVGAHGLCVRDGYARRRVGAATVARYLSDPCEAASVEQLDAATHLGERLFTGLRTAFGVDVQDLGVQFGPALAAKAQAKLERLCQQGYVRQEVGAMPGVASYLCSDGQRWVPTAKGLRYADDVAAMVV